MSRIETAFRSLHPRPRPGPQAWLLDRLSLDPGVTLADGPPGITGKTALGLAWLLAAAKAGQKGLYVTTNKTLVAQLVHQYPGSAVPLTGRNEYLCRDPRWDNVPCDKSMCNYLGSQHHPDVVFDRRGVASLAPHQTPACEYPVAKAAALNAPIMVTDYAHALFSHAFAKRPLREFVVLDEVDQAAKVVRGVLEKDVTNYTLERAVTMAETHAHHIAGQFRALLRAHNALVEKYEGLRKEKGLKWPILIEREDLVDYRRAWNSVDILGVVQGFKRSVQQGWSLTPDDYKAAAEFFERMSSTKQALHYAVPKGLDRTESIIYAQHEPDRQSATHIIAIKPWKVNGLIRTYLTGTVATLGLTGTLGDETILGYETGLFGQVLRAPAAPRREAPVVVVNGPADFRSRPGIRKSLDWAAAFTHKVLQTPGVGALILTHNHREALRLHGALSGNGIRVMTYGKGKKAGPALKTFLEDRSVQGFIGPATGAAARGADLPRRCNVLCLYKPPYAVPNTPVGQFELERFPESYWSTMYYRAGAGAQQAMDRTLRSDSDATVRVLFCRSFQANWNRLHLRPEVAGGARVLGPDQALRFVRKFIREHPCERPGGAGPTRGRSKSRPKPKTGRKTRSPAAKSSRRR